MEISQADCVKHEEVLQGIKEINFLHTIQGREEGRKEERKEGRKANGFCHIFHRNFLLKHVFEGKIKGRESDEKDVNSQHFLRKTEGTGI